MKIKITGSITEVDKDAYNAIQDKTHPFLDHDFLMSLEKSGCIGKLTSWDPRYILLFDDQKLIASLAFFIKTDSHGEFIFDWEWARAYENAGLTYYPKGVVGVPFTPTTGKRINVHPEYDHRTCSRLLIDAMVTLSKELSLSSIHCLFIDGQEREILAEAGFLDRTTHQYHWENRNYANFDNFLEDLRSSKRKQIKKERKPFYNSKVKIHVLGGDSINKEHIDAMWQFYNDTNMRKWGNAYLNYEFFDLIHEHFSDKILMVMAKNEETWLGGSINFLTTSKLFGRYWGTVTNISNLHFECCYYSLIEYAIQNKIKWFEAGAQGEHKFLRGFKAVPVYSSHLIFNPSARDFVKKYLMHERNYFLELIKKYNKRSPLKYLNGSQV